MLPGGEKAPGWVVDARFYQTTNHLGHVVVSTYQMWTCRLSYGQGDEDGDVLNIRSDKYPPYLSTTATIRSPSPTRPPLLWEGEV